MRYIRKEKKGDNMDKSFLKDNKWKNENFQYLYELQKFLDLADNIEDEELRLLIIGQMLKCDRCITNALEAVLDILEDKKVI